MDVIPGGLEARQAAYASPLDYMNENIEYCPNRIAIVFLPSLQRGYCFVWRDGFKCLRLSVNWTYVYFRMEIEKQTKIEKGPKHTMIV